MIYSHDIEFINEHDALNMFNMIFIIYRNIPHLWDIFNDIYSTKMMFIPETMGDGGCLWCFCHPIPHPKLADSGPCHPDVSEGYPAW